ncbi:hypothetical protein BJ508DRAFT_330625 [Ascobolus immersus RN42]|uniref:LysM domain-containing protein n=1 Tax=Ascobolus immersus RN42 TaxID=1160509 RepID=A0A3N4I522_ASCIM|nr:hypothetical protein BJ508DRAFT_330625 [Ascobolus immersus RN42]
MTPMNGAANIYRIWQIIWNQKLKVNELRASGSSLLIFNNTGRQHMRYDLLLGVPGPGEAPDPCHNCVIQNLKFRAESPLFDGLSIVSEGRYESLTSKCSASSFPLTTTMYEYLTMVPTPTMPVPTCTGTVYTIQDADDCSSLAKSEGISTGWLISDNNLEANCHGFPTSGSLYLVNKCPTHTVQKDDTCDTISDAYGINFLQLDAWNSVLDIDCMNIDQQVGTELCVDVPGVSYFDPLAASTLVISIWPTIATTATAVPTNTAPGTTAQCGTFHDFAHGENCAMLLLEKQISLRDFRHLNADVDERCTNLVVGQVYCVEPVGYIDYDSTMAADFPSPLSDSFAELPEATWVSYQWPERIAPVYPTANNSRTDCYHYIHGKTVHGSDLTGTSYKSDCDLAARSYDVTLEEFGTWNPSMGDPSDPACTLDVRFRYCARFYEKR